MEAGMRAFLMKMVPCMYFWAKQKGCVISKMRMVSNLSITSRSVSVMYKVNAPLKGNNNLYKDIPAYTVEQIQEIIKQKLEKTGNYEPKDAALLKKLDESSKSFLYENFSIQPLSNEFPQDIIQTINSTIASTYMIMI